MPIENKITRKIIPGKKARSHWFVIIFIIFCELLTYTWIRTQSLQTILQLSGNQQLITKKSSYQKALFIEIDRLKSDDRITKIARTRFNLLTDTLNQTIYLPASKTLKEVR